MKKTFISLLALLICISAWGQYSSHGGFSFSEDRLYYGIRIGVTGAYIRTDNPMLNVSKMKAGFTFGGVVGLRLSESTPVYLESGLYYVNRGGKGSSDNKIKTSINTLEIPLLIKYGIGLPNDMALLPFAGAFADMGMGRGHYRNYSIMDHDHAIKKSRYQRFDAGLKVGCGFEYKMLYVELGYNFGLANMVHETTEFESGHSGGIFANFGVNF